MTGLSSPLLVQIEVPRFGIVKRRGDGGIDFISPLPCPYNYGFVPGTLSPDGDPLDALVLGPRVPYGTVCRTIPRAVIGFLDGGEVDPKLICCSAALTVSQRLDILRFFQIYAASKWMLNALRGRRRPTRCLGWQSLDLIERFVTNPDPG